MKRKPCSEKNPSTNIKTKPPYSNSPQTQRERILKIFRKQKALSTIQARNEYGILHPGGRIMELRKKGHDIETIWISEPDGNGVMHRIGLYVYRGVSS